MHYDLLVAADGAGSLIRAQLAKQMPEGYVRRIRHNVVYSTIGLRPPADQIPGHAFFEMHHFEVSTLLACAFVDLPLTYPPTYLQCQVTSCLKPHLAFCMAQPRY